MINRKIADIAGTITLFIGFFFAFLPHAFHSKASFNQEIAHLKFVIVGMLLVLVGLAILILSSKTQKAL